MRKFLVVSLTLMMLLTACGDKGSSGSSGRGSFEPTSSPSTQVQLPLPGEDEVQFELDGSDPNFSELQQPAVDLSNTPDYTNQGVSGGAPGTGIGSPSGELPNGDASGGAVEGEAAGGGAAVDSSDEAGAAPAVSGSSNVTPENKYPNTGLFPEDE